MRIRTAHLDMRIRTAHLDFMSGIAWVEGVQAALSVPSMAEQC
jgi:hypothetical protein